MGDITDLSIVPARGTGVNSYNPNRAYGRRASASLTTPTYEGSGEATHPDVYDAGAGSTWNGYRYWMAMTPYPGGDNAFENPSILVSADGDTWIEPAGIANPIAPAPASGYYADTDLILTPDGLTMWCIYRHHGIAVPATLARSSTDGVTWSAEITLFTSTDSLASPAVIWDGSQFVMFIINHTAEPYVIERCTASAIDGVWSARTPVTAVPPTATQIWHIDVIKDGGTLYVAINTSSKRLYFGISTDSGLTWQIGTFPVFNPPATGWDVSHYRASIVKTSSGFDIWYAGYAGTPVVWGIGRTEIVF
jgi:hypothetical protein